MSVSKTHHQSYTARTTALDLAIDTEGCRAAHVIIKTTTVGSASLTPTIQGIDPGSGDKYTLLAGTAITTDVTRILKVGPAMTAAANLVANDHLPPRINLNIAVADANPATYSVGVVLMG